MYRRNPAAKTKTTEAQPRRSPRGGGGTESAAPAHAPGPAPAGAPAAAGAPAPAPPAAANNLKKRGRGKPFTHKKTHKKRQDATEVVRAASGVMSHEAVQLTAVNASPLDPGARLPAMAGSVSSLSCPVVALCEAVACSVL